MVRDGMQEAWAWVKIEEGRWRRRAIENEDGESQIGGK